MLSADNIKKNQQFTVSIDLYKNYKTTVEVYFVSESLCNVVFQRSKNGLAMSRVNPKFSIRVSNQFLEQMLHFD